MRAKVTEVHRRKRKANGERRGESKKVPTKVLNVRYLCRHFYWKVLIQDIKIC